MKKTLLLLFISTIAFSQTREPKAGELIDFVPITASLDTYAVYLPVNYTPEKQWPVIMVFDASGRGKLAVSRFREAANKYGYIIAGSNGIKNGTYQENLNIARSFYSQVLNNYSVDQDAIYLAGFSGGARLATTIAVISKHVKGVITCGAAFANNDAYIPKKNSFLFVGIVGDEDFNYREMTNSKGYLDKLKFDADLLVFSGGHVWPPENYITKAVRVMSLKSMTRNIIPKDESAISKYFSEDMQFNKELINKGAMLVAYNDIQDIMKNYRFYVEKDTMKDRQKEIKRSKLFRSQRNDQYYINDVESAFYMDYMTYLPSDINSGELESLAYWEDEINTLNKEYVNSANLQKQKMGKRVLSFLNVLPTELEEKYNENDGLDNLLYINIFKTLANPKDYSAYITVMRYTVTKGEYGMALYYLEKMLDNGFKDTERLNNEDGIALLRIQPEYNELLDSYGLKTMY
ncbi:alpha/beta hydrolase [Galbibacter sp. PAP.153]|uniref:alpha/beta hydrolase n=1 Tax=Galbibacter sp. PAP.153 TaxID=3104623 RepID=UPI003008B0E8